MHEREPSGSSQVARARAGGAEVRHVGGPRHPCQIESAQPLAMLAEISLAAASRRSLAPALPAMMSAVAWPNGCQTEFIAAMFGIGLPSTPASYQALTSGSVAATSSYASLRAGGRL